MSREVKRVPIDFNWPLDKIWEGFQNPYWQLSAKCSVCYGTGYNADTKRLADDWYDFDRTGRRWAHRLELHEVKALVAAGRLHNLVKRFVTGEGWVDRDPPVPVDHALVAAVNHANDPATRHGFGHDAINRYICIQARAERLGVYGHCTRCDEHAREWSSPEAKAKYDAWKEFDPPTGEGWQLWETVSEGSPITPVFATAEELVAHLSKPKTPGSGSLPWASGYTPEAARALVKKGSCMSMVISNGRIMDGAQALAEREV